MLSFKDLFQWDCFITPSIIKVFYWLAVGLSVLFGLSSAASALSLMVHNIFAGLFALLASLLGCVVGVLVARIAAEFVLIVFRINEHLGAIRNSGRM